jgi:hypothetical protein
VSQLLLQIKPNINISAVEEYAFCSACRRGYLEVAQWLLHVNPNINISADNEGAFRWACEQGHLPVIQWLLQVDPNINISANDEYAFRWACYNGHLEVVQHLIQVKPTIDISIRDDYAFKGACYRNHLHVAQWLVSLAPDRYQIMVVNYDMDDVVEITYNIALPLPNHSFTSLPKHDPVLHLTHINNCTICDEALSNLQTPCGHQFCEPCLQKWLFNEQQSSNKQSCPYCRTDISIETNTFQPIAEKK